MKSSKVITILIVALFPLGILYCIGKNLWSRDWTSFLGGLFLFLGGMVVTVVWLRPNIIDSIKNFFIR